MKPRIPYTKPAITELKVGHATDAAANGCGEGCHAYIESQAALFK
jgi:perosamine synthetase